MRLVFVATLVIMFLVACCGCGATARQQHIAAAEHIAVVANQTAYVLKNEYAMDPDPNKEVNWEPVFDAWDRFKALHDAYREALDHGQDPDVSPVLDALCLAVDAVPVQVAAKVHMPGLCSLEAP